MDLTNLNAFATPNLLQSALTHLRSGQFQQAAALCQQVLATDPNNSDALHILGMIHLQMNRPSDAVPVLRRAVEKQPKINAYRRNYAEALRQTRDLVGAEREYREAIALNPKDARSLSNLGGILREKNRREEAIDFLRRAAIADPNYAQAFNNLGTTLTELGRLDEAEAALRGAIRLNPKYPSPYNNLALVHLQREDLDKALAELDRALALVFNYPDAHWHRAMTLLTAGRFTEGWREYDWRFLTTHVDTVRGQRISMLRPGSDVRGVRIHCCGEQGLGDMIQFSRFAIELAERGAEVSIDLPDSLRELFAHLPLQVLPKGEVNAAADVVTPLMSLGNFFQTTIENIPKFAGYLSVSDEKLATWRSRIRMFDGLRIGFASEGSARHPNNLNRNCPLEHWRPLFELPRTKWFSLQLPALRDLPPNITDLAPHLADLSETAAAIMNFDVVITVDTSVAHLAGALGKPVWILIAKGPDWRWLLHRDDSPWYKSARLFRQQKAGDWKTVMEKVQHELPKMVPAH